MSDPKLKSQDHKQIIAGIMRSIADVMTDNERASLLSEHGCVVGVYLNPKKWKRRSKLMLGRTVVRTFRHDDGPGSIEVHETSTGPDRVSVALKMGDDLPEQIVAASARIKPPEEFAFGNVAAAPKESMLDGPKPEGFGDFS